MLGAAEMYGVADEVLGQSVWRVGDQVISLACLLQEEVDAGRAISVVVQIGTDGFDALPAADIGQCAIAGGWFPDGRPERFTAQQCPGSFGRCRIEVVLMSRHRSLPAARRTLCLRTLGIVRILW